MLTAELTMTAPLVRMDDTHLGRIGKRLAVDCRRNSCLDAYAKTQEGGWGPGDTEGSWTIYSLAWLFAINYSRDPVVGSDGCRHYFAVNSSPFDASTTEPVAGYIWRFGKETCLGTDCVEEWTWNWTEEQRGQRAEIVSDPDTLDYGSLWVEDADGNEWIVACFPLYCLFACTDCEAGYCYEISVGGPPPMRDKISWVEMLPDATLPAEWVVVDRIPWCMWIGDCQLGTAGKIDTELVFFYDSTPELFGTHVLSHRMRYGDEIIAYQCHYAKLIEGTRWLPYIQPIYGEYGIEGAETRYRLGYLLVVWQAGTSPPADGAGCSQHAVGGNVDIYYQGVTLADSYQSAPNCDPDPCPILEDPPPAVTRYPRSPQPDYNPLTSRSAASIETFSGTLAEFQSRTAELRAAGTLGGSRYQRSCAVSPCSGSSDQLMGFFIVNDIESDLEEVTVILGGPLTGTDCPGEPAGPPPIPDPPESINTCQCFNTRLTHTETVEYHTTKPEEVVCWSKIPGTGVDALNCPDGMFYVHVTGRAIITRGPQYEPCQSLPFVTGLEVSLPGWRWQICRYDLSYDDGSVPWEPLKNPEGVPLGTVLQYLNVDMWLEVCRDVINELNDALKLRWLRSDLRKCDGYTSTHDLPPFANVPDPNANCGCGDIVVTLDTLTCYSDVPVYCPDSTLQVNSCLCLRLVEFTLPADSADCTITGMRIRWNGGGVSSCYALIDGKQRLLYLSFLDGGPGAGEWREIPSGGEGVISIYAYYHRDYYLDLDVQLMIEGSCTANIDTIRLSGGSC